MCSRRRDGRVIIQYVRGTIRLIQEATLWLGVYLDSSLTLKEHHRTRMRKARQAEDRLRRFTGQFGLTPEHCRRIQVACVQASALFGSELWWTNGRGFKGQANDMQLMVNRQARSTIGCYKSTNQHRRARGGGWPTARHITSGQQAVALRPETSGASQLGPSPLCGRS